MRDRDRDRDRESAGPRAPSHLLLVNMGDRRSSSREGSTALPRQSGARKTSISMPGRRSSADASNLQPGDDVGSLHASAPPGLETIAGSANPLRGSTADLDNLGAQPVPVSRLGDSGGRPATFCCCCDRHDYHARISTTPPHHRPFRRPPLSVDGRSSQADNKRNLQPMDVESDGLDVPAHPDKGRASGGSPGMRRSSFGARASSFISEAVGPRASMAAERVSIYAARSAKGFVSTPARRPHSSMRPAKFEEELEVDTQPLKLKRTESAFMGAARVAGGQLTGDGQYGVESDIYPYVAILLVVACLAIFGWEMWENDLRLVVQGVYCCAFMLLPIAPCCSQCLLLVVRRSIHAQQ